MKGRKEEAEVIIRLDQLEGVANICVSCWPSMARKCLRLYGEPLPRSGNQAHYWRIPLKAVSLRRISTSTTPRKVPSSAFKRDSNRQSDGSNLHSAATGPRES